MTCFSRAGRGDKPANLKSGAGRQPLPRALPNLVIHVRCGLLVPSRCFASHRETVRDNGETEPGKPRTCFVKQRKCPTVSRSDSLTHVCLIRDRRHWVQERLIGRIVGVSSTPLGSLLEPAAGYVDEDAANLAFDEGEYLDIIIATGHEPRVCRGRDGKWSYWEKMTGLHYEKFTQDEEFAVRRKEGAASTGMDRIIAECVRRGLID
jgi:hypothetical protein